MSPHLCWRVRLLGFLVVCRVLSLLKHVQFLISLTVQTLYRGLWNSASLGPYISGLLSAFSLLLSSNAVLQFCLECLPGSPYTELPVTPQVCIQASWTLDGHSDPLPKVLPFLLISAIAMSVCRKPCGCLVCSVFTGPPFPIKCCVHKVK